MHDQDRHWSNVAGDYEKEFVDPYREDVFKPVQRVLRALGRRGCAAVADLGCGIGPLLPYLCKHFHEVWGVDFAEGMLARARENAAKCKVTYLCRSLLDLTPLHGKLDVAAAINSLVMPSVADQERVLAEIRQCLKPDGWFVGVLPALDGVHYLSMLLMDRALASGKTMDAARKNVRKLNDLEHYDFEFGQFRFQGIEQHFWQPFEIGYRFRRAGLRVVRMRKLRLSWRQFAGWRELEKYPSPWDWFVVARPIAGT